MRLLESKNLQTGAAPNAGRGLVRAAFNLLLGCFLGLALLEAVVQVNPALLLRGMALPAPVDAPLRVNDYTVRYSDADLFYWHAGLIRPIPPGQDEVEAEVHFQTDEFGFPNAGPAAGPAGVVVLGRSYSLGAQAAHPWPQLLAAQTGLTVVNLSEPASGIGLKRAYLARFGRPRRPRWVVVEVLPSMDIIGYSRTSLYLVPQLPLPLAQTLLRRVWPSTAAAGGAPIYPLAVDIPGRTAHLVFFSYYLAALTVDEPALLASWQWAEYQQELRALVSAARAEGACVILLYAPTKEEIYVPLAIRPDQLAPSLRIGWSAWRLDAGGDLVQDQPAPASAEQMQAAAGQTRAMLASSAAAEHLHWVDPSPALTAAALSGNNPFMHYDSHWSAVGQALVAQAVAQEIQASTCP